MTDGVKVDVRRSGRRFEAEAVFDLGADAQTVWDTITDYDALPRFMPGIRSCRVLARQVSVVGEEQLVVEQLGEFRFMLFAQAITLHLSITHQPLRVAEAKAVHFNPGLFKRRAIEVFEGRYELTPLVTLGEVPRTQVRYTSQIGLWLPPPPAIGSVAVRQNLAAQLEAVAKEVARRSNPVASPRGHW
jgi:hypothetical protein